MQVLTRTPEQGAPALSAYPDSSPRPHLERQVARIERLIVLHEGTSRRFSLLRLLILLAGIGVALLLFREAGEVAGWSGVVVGVIAFALVANAHARLLRGIERLRAFAEVRKEEIARIDRRWEDLPPSPFTADPNHPFDRDLDISGQRSLHQLLDTSTTHEGSRRLRAWLLETEPERDRSLRRQELVRELVPLTAFRDRLRVVGRLGGHRGRERWRDDALLAWVRQGGSSQQLVGRLLLLALLATATIALFIAGTLELLPANLWPASLILYAAVYLFRRGDFQELFGDAMELELGLSRLSAVLHLLERGGWSGARRLNELRAPFLDRSTRPSRSLRSVGRIVSAASIQANPLLRLLLNVTLPWDYFFAWRLARVREEIAERLPEWLDIWYEIEAASSLAGHAWLNPEASFPTIAEPGGLPLLEGEGLGHPLIPADRRVSNDLTIAGVGSTLILTGSNMSGKSTMLRTVGVNAVLAFAGGAVTAGRLRVVPLRVHACINVADSVNDGISYFYAEVRRLRQLLERSGDAGDPQLFLIDEIFRGTNNRERLIGSRAFVRELSRRNAAGAISTHDLELVHLVEEIPTAENYHFREEVIEGEMVFDYRLRQGPSPTTNALAIMKMEGLPIDG